MVHNVKRNRGEGLRSRGPRNFNGPRGGVENKQGAAKIKFHSSTTQEQDKGRTLYQKITRTAQKKNAAQDRNKVAALEKELQGAEEMLARNLHFRQYEFGIATTQSVQERPRAYMEVMRQHYIVIHTILEMPLLGSEMASIGDKEVLEKIKDFLAHLHVVNIQMEDLVNHNNIIGEMLKEGEMEGQTEFEAVKEESARVAERIRLKIKEVEKQLGLF